MIYIVTIVLQWSRNGLDGPGSIPGSAIFFSSPQRRDPLRVPPSLLTSGHRRREADHSLPSSAEVKNGELYLHSPMRLHGMVF
jgi:hypothetical protein